ncbi:MAG: TolC family protein [Rhodothermaceae bacterium]
MFGNRIAIFKILLLLISSLLFAQESGNIKLTLNQALELAAKNNHDLRSAKADVSAFQADKNKSLAVFFPRVNVQETYIKTNDPLNSFGFKLKQEIVTQMDFNPALLNDPDNIENFQTKLQVQQPLINMDGFFGRAAADEGLSAMKNKSARTANYINFQVKLTYFNLVLSHKSLSVVNQALESARAAHKLISDYYSEGLITKADLLMADVFVADLESKKVEAENNYRNVNENLKLLTGITEEGTISPVDKLELIKPQFDSIDRNNILKNRSDLLAYKHKMNAMKYAANMNWMKFLPRLNAFAEYEFNDTKAFGSNAKSWTVGLNLRWDIFKGFENIGSVQKSEAEYDKAKIEYEKNLVTGKNQISSSLRDFEAAGKKLVLAENAQKQSGESLRIIKDRFSKGLEKTSDLLNAETAYSNSKLNYLKTLFFYNMSVFKIELMTETKIY